MRTVRKLSACRTINSIGVLCCLPSFTACFNRGYSRVGRGAAASSCVLMYQAPLSAMARQRLETMRQTSDGFVIAEKDLELRGPGELLGTRQTGLAAFRVADLARDAALLPGVHALAERLLAEAPAVADRIVARWVGGAARYASA